MNLKSLLMGRWGIAFGLSLVLMLLLIPWQSEAKIYINNIPEDITVTEGEPIDIPVFFDAEDLAGSTVDLYILKKDHPNGANLQCLTPQGWIPLSDISQRMPLISGYSPMMDYFYVVWRAFSDSSNMSSFELTLCLTGQVDNSLKEICSQRRIINILPPSQGVFHTVSTVSSGNGKVTPLSQKVIEGGTVDVTATADPTYHVASMKGCGIDYSNTSNSVSSHTETTAPVTADCEVNVTFEPNQSNNCGGLNLSVTQVNESLKRGETKTIDITVNDSCGNGIDFEASSTIPWLSLTREMGMLHIMLQTSSLAPNSYKGEITVKANGQSKTIGINLTVTAPTIPLPGGGGGCTPSSINLWPVDITASAGETKQQSVSVTNNCGSPLSYTATVTKGNSWLSAPSSGSGSMLITVNTSGLSAGTYQGEIKVTSGNLTGYLSVSLTVSGPCTASRAVIDPSSITKTIVVGEQVGAVSVTVKDNCGKPLGYTVDGITYTTGSGGWITAPSQGNGSLSISFSSTNLPAGSYSASIALTPSGYSQTAINIKVDVSAAPPPPPPANNITRLTDNTRVRIKLQSKQYAYFYFETASLDPNDLNKYTHPLTKTDVLEVRLEPYANYYAGGDMLVRYAGTSCDGKLPTLDELNYTWSTNNWQPGWRADLNPPRWYPPRWRDDLYWYLSKYSAFEPPQIGGDPHYPLGCWYILVYNDDRAGQGMSDLYISFREYAAKYHGPGY